MSGQGWPAVGGRGQIGGAVAGAAAFVAPFGRKPCGAPSCRARLPGDRPHAVPAVPARCRARPGGPDHQPCARCAVAGESSQAASRNAAHYLGRPLPPQGHPKIPFNRSAERIFRTHPCARSLWRPSGPDGKGQAKGQTRHARGEPQHLPKALLTLMPRIRKTPTVASGRVHAPGHRPSHAAS
jgi:hypothetical protein